MRRPLPWQSMRRWTLLGHFSSDITFSRPFPLSQFFRDLSVFKWESQFFMKYCSHSVEGRVQNRDPFGEGVFQKWVKKLSSRRKSRCWPINWKRLQGIYCPRKLVSLTSALQKAGRGPSEKEDFWRRCAACTPALTTAKGGGSEKEHLSKISIWDPPMWNKGPLQALQKVDHYLQTNCGFYVNKEKPKEHRWKANALFWRREIKH